MICICCKKFSTLFDARCLRQLIELRLVLCRSITHDSWRAFSNWKSSHLLPWTVVQPNWIAACRTLISSRCPSKTFAIASLCHRIGPFTAAFSWHRPFASKIHFPTVNHKFRDQFVHEVSFGRLKICHYTS